MNLYEVMPPKEGEIFKALYEKDGVLIEQIVSSDKLEKRVYKQAYDEWLTLLKGKALLRVCDKEISLSTGDTFLIQRDEEHEVQSCEHGTIWLCVHLKGNSDV